MLASTRAPMVGITALFAFIGVACGLIAGLWWGFAQSWLIGLAASAGGAVGGGVIGCIAGFISQEIPDRIARFSKSHHGLGIVFFWLFWLLWLACIVLFAYASFSFIRLMQGH